MTLSELSDADCSRWIAEKLETQPNYTCYVTGQIGLSVITNLPTDKGPWRWNFSDKCWQPRDMVNDPAMTVLLLGKILVSGTQVEIAANDGGYTAKVEFPKPSPMYTLARVFSNECDFIGRAVAEAWMLANGWTE